jgi:hypothetical protein
MKTAPISPLRPSPSHPTAAPASQELVDHLQRLIRKSGRRWKRLILLESVSLTLTVTLAYLWLIFFADNLFHLPVWVRLLAGLAFLGGIFWLGKRLVRRWKQLRLTEDEVALAMERHTPGGVQNRLINAVQISRDGRSAPPEFGAALVRENYQRLQQVRLEQAARVRPALTRLAVAGVLVLVGLLFWFARPEHFRNAASRFLLPFADIDPLYRTTLVVEPGDVIAAGDVTIRITIRGERPETLKVLRQSGGRRSSEIVPVEPGEGAVTYTFRGVERSLTYAVQGGDFTSPTYRIQVPRTTALSLVRATYQYPAYTNLPDKSVESTGGDLEALQGTRAEITFTFDHSVESVTLLLERPGNKAGGGIRVERRQLARLGPTDFRGEFVFRGLLGYRLETQEGQGIAQRSPPYALRVLTDQEPKLLLGGLEQRTDVQLDSVLSLQITATDDYGLNKVGLFVRRPSTQKGEKWRPVIVWQAGGKTSFRKAHELPVSSLGVVEGDRLELALRGSDTDPLKKGRWTTGPVHALTVGGEGVGLQLQYEQIVRTTKELKALAAAQRRVMARAAEWIAKLDGKGDLRWDDARNIRALHAAVKKLGRQQEQVRRKAGRTARAMLRQAGNLRISVGMLADTEMVRVLRILESVATRDQPQGKRAALAEARSTMERTLRSLQEIRDRYAEFRSDWELANMIPFVKMLAARQAKLRDESRRLVEGPAAKAALGLQASGASRQAKILELCRLIRPAFGGLAERLNDSEPTLAAAFASGAGALGAQGLQRPMREAADDARAGRWSAALQKQSVAAAKLASLYVRLRKAQLKAARRVLQALRDKAKSDAQAQKEIKKLQKGSGKSFVKDFPKNLKVDEIIRLRELADAGKKGDSSGEEGRMLDKSLFPEVDRGKLELKKDSGVRQDPNILQLGTSRPKTVKYPNPMDTRGNKVKPFIQKKFQDLVGKLLEEADELGKNYQSLNMSTNQNNNDLGEISKQGGRLNSTGAVAATGNKKPPTSNHGGVSRTGRQGARAHGLVAGDKGVNRRGRDKPLEGQERVADQAGKLKMQKSDDMQKETSTGVGGKQVDTDESHFSLSDAGKFTRDIVKRLGKPQKKNFIVERKGGKFDPKMAALLRDLTSKQEQVIERLKALKKELKNLYLPTDHLDDLMKSLRVNLERLKERPEPDLFRLQVRTLNRLRAAVRVFRTANAGFQPSLPRVRAVKGRVLDEPTRQTLPGYEEAVKRYYQKLASK